MATTFFGAEVKPGYYQFVRKFAAQTATGAGDIGGDRPPSCQDLPKVWPRMPASFEDISLPSRGANLKVERDSKHLTAHPTAAGVLTRLAYRQAKAAGIDVGPIVRQAHMTIDKIEDPTARIRIRDQIRFLNLLSDKLNDDLLGFNLARLLDLREIGWLYYVAASAERMSEALKRAARYTTLSNEGASVHYVDSGNAALEMCYIGVSRHIDRHQIEFFVTILVRMFQQLSGIRVLPTKVRFIHRRKSVPAVFREFMGTNVEFGASADLTAFPESVMDAPVVSADPYLHNLLIACLEQALALRGSQRASFSSAVENEIVPLLPHRKPRAEEVAQRLGTSQRTFARRLAAEGLSFSELLERLRFDLARRHLADRDLSISEIAWLLGYQEVSAFTHAFKRWSGKTPREARRAAA
jgi:AraC-like DNA-binding protein